MIIGSITGSTHFRKPLAFSYATMIRKIKLEYTLRKSNIGLETAFLYLTLDCTTLYICN